MRKIIILSLLAVIACSCSSKLVKNAQPKEEVVYFKKPFDKKTITTIQDMVNAEKMPIILMDIEYGGLRCSGVSTLFMLTPTIGIDTGFQSQGHLSCYSVYVDLGEKYFVAHIDADLCKKVSEIDSLLRVDIAFHVGDASINRILLGASNVEDTVTMNKRLNYIRSLFPQVDEKNWYFFCGPNGNDKKYTLDEFRDLGGPDALITTDILFLPKVSKIIVMRPPNEPKFNESFPLSEWNKRLKNFKK